MLTPCKEYLEEISAQEIIAEEKKERDIFRPERKHGLNLKAAKKCKEDLTLARDPLKMVKIPEKVPLAPSLDSLEARRKDLIPDRHQIFVNKKMSKLDTETEELLKPLNHNLENVCRTYKMP